MPLAEKVLGVPEDSLAMEVRLLETWLFGDVVHVLGRLRPGAPRERRRTSGPGARRGQRFESRRGQHPGRARIPGIWDHEGRTGVQHLERRGFSREVLEPSPDTWDRGVEMAVRHGGALFKIDDLIGHGEVCHHLC